MKLSLPLFILLASLLISGCSTPSSEAPHDANSTKSGPTMSSGKSNAPKPALGETGRDLPDGEFSVLVESAPQAGTVVVNGIPIGKTPQRVVLPGTPHGFFRDQVSVKVRFVAADAQQNSQTIEELFTPLEKIPAVVRFTPAGTSRVGR